MSEINNTNIDFEDTAIAFASKNDDDLRHSYNLFRLFQNSTLINFGSRMTELAFKIGLPVSYPIKLTIFEQFCGGETIEECKVPIGKLAEFEVDTILDYGVEAKESEADMENTAKFLIDNLKLAEADPDINIISGKVTGLIRFALLQKVSDKDNLTEDEQEEWERGQERMHRVSKAAYECDIAIYWDAEESWIQPAIDELVMKHMEEFNDSKPIIYNTIQCYRHDRLAYLKASHQMAIDQGFLLAVKLVRGAYMEKERERAKRMGYPSPIQADKEATDKDYNLALEYCIENLDDIAFCNATHNQKSCLHLFNLLKEKGIPFNHKYIFSSQLFGMSDYLSFNLASVGFNVAKYMPYGPVKEVVPYLLRRAKENSSVNGQMGRELAMITVEMKRRGLLDE